VYTNWCEYVTNVSVAMACRSVTHRLQAFKHTACVSGSVPKYVVQRASLVPSPQRLKTQRQKGDSPYATMSATMVLVTLMTPLVVHVEHDHLSTARCVIWGIVCACARMCVFVQVHCVCVQHDEHEVHRSSLRARYAE
jgi:hypothetical protein